MNEKLLQWLKDKIAEGKADDFYRTRAWKKLSAYVREFDKNECQICRQNGKYSKAELVHHINTVKERPDLALNFYFTDADGRRKRNLISVCKNCHETVCHPEKQWITNQNGKEKFSNSERWD